MLAHSVLSVILIPTLKRYDTRRGARLTPVGAINVIAQHCLAPLLHSAGFIFLARSLKDVNIISNILSPEM